MVKSTITNGQWSIVNGQITNHQPPIVNGQIINGQSSTPIVMRQSRLKTKQAAFDRAMAAVFMNNPLI
jgi:hypothetical protein